MGGAGTHGCGRNRCRIPVIPVIPGTRLRRGPGCGTGLKAPRC